MKKQLFGYSISETDIILDSLKKENESLNAAFSALKKQHKEMLSAKDAEIEQLKAELESENKKMVIKHYRGKDNNLEKDKTEPLPQLRTYIMTIEKTRAALLGLISQTKEEHEKILARLEEMLAEINK